MKPTRSAIERTLCLVGLTAVWLAEAACDGARPPASAAAVVVVAPPADDGDADDTWEDRVEAGPPVEAPPATSDAAKELAKRAYVQALAAQKDGRYEEALAGFSRADSLVPGSAPKFSAAACLDALGRSASAISAYQRFLDAKPTAKYADRVKIARARIAVLQARRR